MARLARLLAVGLSLVLTLPGAVLVGEAGPSAQLAEALPLLATAASPAAPPLLHLKAATFDPAGPLPAVPAALLAPPSPAAGESGADGRVRFILQFEGGVHPGLLSALRARGIDYERYLPDRAIIAAAQPRDVPPSAAAVGARALLPLHPAFKLDPVLWPQAALPAAGALRLSVLFFSPAGARAALEQGLSLLAFDGRLAIGEAAPSALAPLAGLGDVEWIEPYVPPQPLLNYTARIVGARQVADGAFAGNGQSVWSYNPATDTFEGLNGSGVVINIADTGIDATHPAFEGRIVAAFGYGDNATCDCAPYPPYYPHGTLVAGVAAGNGSWRPADENRSDGKFAGVAPGAGLVAQMIWSALRTPAQYSQDAYSAGAFVNSNSWGGDVGGAYTLDSESYDALVLDANGREAGSPQMVYVFASGNSGGGGTAYTVNTPGTAKNVITVGASGNVRWSSPDSIAWFSSRGPTADGRLKPDLVAPGDGVDSTRSVSGGCSADEDGCSYWPNSGTSLATPAVAGAAALTAQWYRDRYGALPSAALVKALLIGGATPLPGYAWPDYNQGWGRLSVSRSLLDGPGFRHLLWDEGPALSQVAGRTNASFRFFAEQGEELRIVLVWSDLPGTASSAKALINDLDLEVRGPDGELYTGNAFASGYSVANSSRDATNNTEVVRLRAPQRGEWSVTVRASSIPSGEQRFALVASGDITSEWVSLVPGAVEFIPDSPREDDPLTVIVPVHNRGTVYPAPFTVEAVLEGPEGNLSATAQVLGVWPGDDFPATFVFAPKRGPHTLRVVVDPGGTSGDKVAQDNGAQAGVLVRGYEVALTPLTNVSALPPLGSAVLLMRVTNLGNVEDTVSLAAAGPSGWGLALNFTSRLLGPGESSFISATLTAPDRALAEEEGAFSFAAVSSGNGSRRDELAVPVRIMAAPSSRIVQADFSAAVDPGASALLRFSLENAGNVPLSFELSSRFAIDPAPGAWSITPARENTQLAPYSRTDRSVLVAVPANATASEFRTVLVEVISVEEGTLSELVFQLTVNRTRGFELAPEATRASGAPGEDLRFPLRVRNLGNGRETFLASVTPSPPGAVAVAFLAENGSLTVPPFSEGFITVVAQLRTFSAAGNATAAVAVVAQGGASAETFVEAQVTAVHRLEGQAPHRVGLQQGSSTVTVITLENLGNTDERVGLLVLATEPGITVSGWEGGRLVERGDILSVQFHVAASFEARAGLAKITLAVVPEAPDLFDRVSFNLTIEVAAATPTGGGFLPGAGAVLAVMAIAAVAAAAASLRRANRPPS